jgi:glycosyltransferase involved in cell wall biosynthesis
LAPLWFLPHWILARFFGVVYVANLHDPVRDYVVGPKWWHDLSVKMAYWPISVGVVHQRLPDLSPVPKHVQVVEAPVGVYDLQEAAVDPELIRAGWGVGKHKAQTRKEDLTTEFTESTEGEMEQPKVGPKGEGAGATESKGEARLRPGSQAGASESDSLASKLADSPVSESLTRSASIPANSGDLKLNSYKLKTPSPEVVFLAFGFIRDNKNLDLVIRALVENPEALLVVMGKAQSKKDKPVDFYRNLARELGVSDRVRFFDEFVPDEKLASYFAAADVVLLTYDKTFHSQSGVLNVAARARRRVLASAGESPLKDCVQKFKLGVFVEPDDLDALKIGMKMVARGESQEAIDSPDWEGYEAFASWDENVAKILEAVENVKH